jgi:hypothetical protein
VHLGPVCAEPGELGRDVHGLLLLRHVAALDAVGAVGYLETDQPEAVELYRGFGYAVVGMADVLGRPCWFMRRPAA